MLSILPQHSEFPPSDMLRSPESPAGNLSSQGLFEDFLREARIDAESAAAPRKDRETAGEETGEDPETPAAPETAVIAALPGLLIPAAPAKEGTADRAGNGDDRLNAPPGREEASSRPGAFPAGDGTPPSGNKLWESAPEGRAGGGSPETVDLDGAEGIDAAGTLSAETSAAEEGRRVLRENRSLRGRIPGGAPEDNGAGPENIGSENAGPENRGPVKGRGKTAGEAALSEAAPENAALETTAFEKAALERAAAERIALEKAASEGAAEQSPGDPSFSAEFLAAAPQGTETQGTERPEPEALSRSPAASRGLEWNVIRAGGRETPARIQDEGPEKTEKNGENRRTGRKRPTLELQDYRIETPEKGAPVSPSSEAELHPETSRNTFFADLEPGGVAEKTAGNNGSRAAGGFEEVLARELRQNLNSDIVRHAQVILRDGGEGLIRLSLKPESLGNVKIRLELTENKITGRIIVESGEALRAFEREIGSLEQAFRDSGYESAELGAFLSQDGQQPGDSPGEDKPFYSPRLAADRAASRYDEVWERTDTALSVDSEGDLLPGNRRISINMLV